MDYLGTASSVIGIVGGLAGLASVYVSVQQWRKTNKKIAMLTNADAAVEILPACTHHE